MYDICFIVKSDTWNIILQLKMRKNVSNARNGALNARKYALCQLIVMHALHMFYSQIRYVEQYFYIGNAEKQI